MDAVRPTHVLPGSQALSHRGLMVFSLAWPSNVCFSPPEKTHMAVKTKKETGQRVSRWSYFSRPAEETREQI